jgi:hypothetical protein
MKVGLIGEIIFQTGYDMLEQGILKDMLLILPGVNDSEMMRYTENLQRFIRKYFG